MKNIELLSFEEQEMLSELYLARARREHSPVDVDKGINHFRILIKKRLEIWKN